MAYTVEDLLNVLHPQCPVKADALCKNRRRIEHGLTTVGLKIHCLGDNRQLLHLVEALGGRSEVIASRVYAHARASVTVILPPVASARSAILLLECIEKYFVCRCLSHVRFGSIAAIASRAAFNGSALRISYGLLCRHLHRNIGHG